MQSKPEAWPEATDVETVPEFHATFDGPWPSVDTGAAGDATVTTVEVRRDLTGGGLPGSARAGAGFSVAEATVTVPQQRRAPMSPWAGPGLQVRPNDGVELAARHGAASMTLGKFLVNEVTGLDSENTITVGLMESQRRLDGPLAYQWTYNHAAESIDAAAVLAACAHQGGYRTTRWSAPPDYSNSRNTGALLYAPMDGSVADEYPQFLTIGGGTTTFSPGWVSAGGQIMYGDDGDLLRWRVPAMANGDTMPVATTTPPTVRATVTGAGATLRINSNTTGDTSLSYRITPTRVTITADRQDGNGQTDTAAWAIPLSPPKTETRTLVITGTADTTPFQVSDADTGEQWQAADGRAATLNIDNMSLTVHEGGGIRDIVASITWQPTYQGQPTALIEHTSSPLVGVFDIGGSSARDVFQDVAKATMGAGWQDEAGRLVYRNASHLRTGTPVETVIADRQLEDIPWAVSRENMADRIELTYTPAVLVNDRAAMITLWEATEKIQVADHQSLTISVDIEGTTDQESLCAFVPIWDEGWPAEAMSRWAASTSPEGGGERPGDLDVSVTATLVGPTRVKIRISNNTNDRIFLVDGTGAPCLTLRATRQVVQGEQVTAAWGVPSEKASLPFTFDCGKWVQDPSVAQQLLDWLSSQMAAPLATIPSVSVKPDLARQIGDVVVLTEQRLTAEHTPLKSKALIVGSTLTGDADGFTQELSLALLATTFADLNSLLVAFGIVTFADLNTFLTQQGIERFEDLSKFIAEHAVAS